MRIVLIGRVWHAGPHIEVPGNLGPFLGDHTCYLDNEIEIFRRSLFHMQWWLQVGLDDEYSFVALGAEAQGIVKGETDTSHVTSTLIIRQSFPTFALSLTYEISQTYH